MPDNGEFSNVTTFVTSEEALPSMCLFKGTLKNKDAFVLMSDGTEQSLYHKPTKMLAGIIVKLMHRTCLLDSGTMKVQLEDAFASVISRNTQDDCSIAILARPSTALCPITDLAFPKRKELYGVRGSDRRTNSVRIAWILYLRSPRLPALSSRSHEKFISNLNTQKNTQPI